MVSTAISLNMHLFLFLVFTNYASLALPTSHQRMSTSSSVGTMPTKWMHTTSQTPNLFKHQQFSALSYRSHNELDSEDNLIKLKVRTSPLFKEDDPRASKKENGKNIPLILSLIINQVGIITLAAGLTSFYVLFSGNGDEFLSDGILNWTGNLNSASSPLNYDLDFALTHIRLAQGILAAVPIIVFGKFIEKSDDRRFATTNFSTLYMILTLFGLRKSRQSKALQGDHGQVATGSKFESLRNTIGEKEVKIDDSCYYVLYFGRG
jgi:hypothetical protein